MKNETVLEINNLNVEFKTLTDSVVALRDISLKVGRKETLGIIGESGCGKSTLSYSIMDYLPTNSQRTGEIRFMGENLLDKSHKEMMDYRGNRIAMVYQNPYSSLNPSLTIGYQLDEVTIMHRKYTHEQARKASLEAMSDLYMGDAEGIAKRYPHQISGGMQQRICIAMALLCRPDLMILDEPTTALDVTTEVVIFDILKELKEKYNMSLIYISHDIGVVNRVADRIAVMYRGEIVETGPQEMLYQHPKHPYTRALINCMPRSGIVKDEVRLNTIPGYVTRRSAVETGCPFVSRCIKKGPGCLEKYGMKMRESGHYSACDRAYAEEVINTLAPKKVTPRNTSHSDETILDVRNLKKHYGHSSRKVRALDGVSVHLGRNEVLGVVGESGCGKSTLGLTISGLLKPSEGSILFDGKEIGFTWKRRNPEILKEIQLIFQNPGRSLNPSFTLEQIIGRPMKKMLGIRSRKERRSRIVEILKKVDLGEEYLNRKATNLSGGEMQRAAIARAFSISPNLLICDEPTSALDVSVQASVLNLLGDLQDESGASYIFISHDLNVINFISDYIIVMYLGKICEYGRREEVVGGPYHPYTGALLSAVPDVDPSLAKTQIRLSGSPPNPTKMIKGCPFAGRCHKQVGKICEEQTPPKVVLSDSHYLFCHIPGDEL